MLTPRQSPGFSTAATAILPSMRAAVRGRTFCVSRAS
ncbi:hypothetical protein FHS26_002510 [Rhizobium pisi]|jgi:hypothetical protein|uniref:Uncharacterized protein n=1 Tax=Rhizobium pisi TaxID=574561 RepID=A0A7W5BKT5_9HYPH|nr:hypothetical protein [Rhizobium pisi]